MNPGKALWCALLLLLVSAPLFAQQPPDNDIWLFDLVSHDQGWRIERPRVLADGPEYENQPSFSPDSKTVLFTRMQDEKTDIWRYTEKDGAQVVVTSEESEFSPTFIPDQKQAIATVRVELDQTQRLWSFTPERGFRLIFESIRPVGYHAWSGERVAMFVLGEPHQLRVARLGSEESVEVDSNIGRCLQKVPGRDAISYTVVEEQRHRLKLYDFSSGRSQSLTLLPEGSQDYVWLDQNTVLTSERDTLVVGNCKTGPWQVVANPEGQTLKGVSRLAVSGDGRTLAVVVEK